MPRLVFLLIFICLTLYLFWDDLRKSDRPSKALAIPLIWMFFAGTREFTQWCHVLGINLGGGAVGPDAYIEGNFVNQQVQFILILCGVVILCRRQHNWGRLFARNIWIWLFFIYGAASIFWSDYPFVSFKRWIKALGTLIMALVILTEDQPYGAFGDVLRRLAILTIPLSVPLCRNYPEIGRHLHRDNWTYTGMATGKNLLGQLCLLAGIYFSWILLFYRNHKNSLKRHREAFLNYSFVAMILYLLHLANSATSVMCLGVAFSLFLWSLIPAVARKPQGYLMAGVILVLIIVSLDSTFQLSESLLASLGRNSSLTDRLPMWERTLGLVTNPMFGAGYESFWLGNRMAYLWETYGYGGIIQSHNGYLETYLNMGFIGLFLMLACIFSGLWKTVKYMKIDYPAAILRLSIIVIVALYNWTEAVFYGISNMWLVFFVAAIDIPLHQKPVG